MLCVCVCVCQRREIHKISLLKTFKKGVRLDIKLRLEYKIKIYLKGVG